MAFSGVETPRVQVQGDVVFVGYGINAPELKWNDYAGVDVKGKWVLIMVNDPPAPADEPTLFGGPGAHLLRPLDLQVRGSRATGCSWCAADSHRRIRHLSVAGRAVVLERHPVHAAARARTAGARHQGVDDRACGARPGQARPARISTRCGRERRSAASRPCRSASGPPPPCSSARRGRRRPTSSPKLPGANDQQAVVFTSHWDHFGIA